MRLWKREIVSGLAAVLIVSIGMGPYYAMAQSLDRSERASVRVLRPEKIYLKVHSGKNEPLPPVCPIDPSRPSPPVIVSYSFGEQKPIRYAGEIFKIDSSGRISVSPEFLRINSLSLQNVEPTFVIRNPETLRETEVQVNLSTAARIWNGFIDEFERMYGEETVRTLLIDLGVASMSGAAVFGYAYLAAHATPGAPILLVVDGIVIGLLSLWIAWNVGTFFTLYLDDDYEGVGAHLARQVNYFAFGFAGGCAGAALASIRGFGTLIGGLRNAVEPKGSGNPPKSNLTAEELIRGFRTNPPEEGSSYPLYEPGPLEPVFEPVGVGSGGGSTMRLVSSYRSPASTTPPNRPAVAPFQVLQPSNLSVPFSNPAGLPKNSAVGSGAVQVMEPIRSELKKGYARSDLEESDLSEEESLYEWFQQQGIQEGRKRQPDPRDIQNSKKRTGRSSSGNPPSFFKIGSDFAKDTYEKALRDEPPDDLPGWLLDRLRELEKMPLGGRFGLWMILGTRSTRELSSKDLRAIALVSDHTRAWIVARFFMGTVEGIFGFPQRVTEFRDGILRRQIREAVKKNALADGPKLVRLLRFLHQHQARLGLLNNKMYEIARLLHSTPLPADLAASSFNLEDGPLTASRASGLLKEVDARIHRLDDEVGAVELTDAQLETIMNQVQEEADRTDPYLEKTSRELEEADRAVRAAEERRALQVGKPKPERRPEPVKAQRTFTEEEIRRISERAELIPRLNGWISLLKKVNRAENSREKLEPIYLEIEKLILKPIRDLTPIQLEDCLRTFRTNLAQDLKATNRKDLLNRFGSQEVPPDLDLKKTGISIKPKQAAAAESGDATSLDDFEVEQQIAQSASLDLDAITAQAEQVSPENLPDDLQVTNRFENGYKGLSPDHKLRINRALILLSRYIRGNAQLKRVIGKILQINELTIQKGSYKARLGIRKQALRIIFRFQRSVTGLRIILDEVGTHGDVTGGGE
ncbi:MAG: hypothetical protein V1495_05925 [Pseudomonadota bacterium]